MNLNDMKWSKTEKETARRAFEKAYRKECAEWPPGSEHWPRRSSRRKTSGASMIS